MWKKKKEVFIFSPPRLFFLSILTYPLFTEQWANLPILSFSLLFYTNVTQLVLTLGFSEASSNNRLRTRAFAFTLPQVPGHVRVHPGCSLSCLSNKMGSP